HLRLPSPRSRDAGGVAAHGLPLAHAKVADNVGGLLFLPARTVVLVPATGRGPTLHPPAPPASPTPGAGLPRLAGVDDAQAGRRRGQRAGPSRGGVVRPAALPSLPGSSLLLRLLSGPGRSASRARRSTASARLTVLTS